MGLLPVTNIVAALRLQLVSITGATNNICALHFMGYGVIAGYKYCRRSAAVKKCGSFMSNSLELCSNAGVVIENKCDKCIYFVAV